MDACNATGTCTPGATPSFWVTELFDWQAHRWTLVDFRFLDGLAGIGADGDEQFPDTVVPFASRYINGSNKIYCRLYCTVQGGNVTGSHGGTAGAPERRALPSLLGRGSW